MEKRALVAIVLSIAVMAIWQIYFAPPPPTPRQAIHQDSSAPSLAEQPAPNEAGPVAAAPGKVESASATSLPSAPPAQPVQAASKEEFRLITDTQDLRLTNEGGRISWWRLLKYTMNGDIAVDLIPQQARDLGVLPLQVEVPSDAELTKTLAAALYTHELTEIPAGDASGMGPGKRVVFRYADGTGVEVTKTLDVPQEGYVMRVAFDVRRAGRPLAATLLWATGLAQPTEDDTRSYGHVEGAGVVYDGQNVSRLPAAGVTEPRLYTSATGTPIVWAGLESTYFASLILGPAPTPAPQGAPPNEQPLQVALHPRGVSADKKTPPLLTAGIQSDGGGSYRLFVGPKDHDLLTSLGQNLELVIDFSRFSVIYLCTKWLFHALKSIHTYVGNYGWSIIILTFLVRLAFFPLTYRSSISMRQTSKKMAKVQPRVKAIQERYRKMKKSMETQGKMNEEVMALYKKEGINPMGNLGGCLPLLLQMPIFIAFYNLLAVTIEMRHAPFIFWIHDLSRRDPYYISPLLMGASWLLQQWMTGASIPDPTQRRMMMFMPVMFTFFMMNMPSGLVVYWLTSNVLGMAQQYVTNKKADQLEAEAHGREVEA